MGTRLLWGMPLIHTMQESMASDLAKIGNTLWNAADRLRANSGIRPADYARPVMGLLFLRHADERFTKVDYLYRVYFLYRRYRVANYMASSAPNDGSPGFRSPTEPGLAARAAQQDRHDMRSRIEYTEKALIFLAVVGRNTASQIEFVIHDCYGSLRKIEEFSN
jgi:type I restriction-modification system DNA methylase subunit